MRKGFTSCRSERYKPTFRVSLFEYGFKSELVKDEGMLLVYA